MTRYINKGPEGYRPFAPQHPHILSHTSNVAQPVNQDGLFYLKNERSSDGVVSITDYQEWCEIGWKQQHGTYEAATRFIDKLVEETGEMHQALIDFQQSGSDRESEQAAELLSELGDVLWCTTALASNSTADIDTGLKNRFGDYAAGVLYWPNGRATPTSWRNIAGALSYKFANITSADINELIEHQFEPLPTPIANIYDDEPEFDSVQHVGMVMINALALRSAAEQQYVYGDGSYVMPETYDGHAVDISIEAAEIFLNVAYIAKHELGADLALVINKNISKITSRIQAGRIDKTDGQRDADLL